MMSLLEPSLEAQHELYQAKVVYGKIQSRGLLDFQIVQYLHMSEMYVVFTALLKQEKYQEKDYEKQLYVFYINRKTQKIVSLPIKYCVKIQVYHLHGPIFLQFLHLCKYNNLKKVIELRNIQINEIKILLKTQWRILRCRPTFIEFYYYQKTGVIYFIWKCVQGFAEKIRIMFYKIVEKQLKQNKQIESFIQIQRGLSYEEQWKFVKADRDSMIIWFCEVVDQPDIHIYQFSEAHWQKFPTKIRLSLPQLMKEKLPKKSEKQSGIYLRNVQFCKETQKYYLFFESQRCIQVFSCQITNPRLTYVRNISEQGQKIHHISQQTPFLLQIFIITQSTYAPLFQFDYHNINLKCLDVTRDQVITNINWKEKPGNLYKYNDCCPLEACIHLNDEDNCLTIELLKMEFWNNTAFAGCSLLTQLLGPEVDDDLLYYVFNMIN